MSIYIDMEKLQQVVDWAESFDLREWFGSTTRRLHLKTIRLAEPTAVQRILQEKARRNDLAVEADVPPPPPRPIRRLAADVEAELKDLLGRTSSVCASVHAVAQSIRYGRIVDTRADEQYFAAIRAVSTLQAELVYARGRVDTLHHTRIDRLGTELKASTQALESARSKSNTPLG